MASAIVIAVRTDRPASTRLAADLGSVIRRAGSDPALHEIEVGLGDELAPPVPPPECSDAGGDESLLHAVAADQMDTSPTRTALVRTKGKVMEGCFSSGIGPERSAASTVNRSVWCADLTHFR